MAVSVASRRVILDSVGWFPERSVTVCSGWCDPFVVAIWHSLIKCTRLMDTLSTSMPVSRSRYLFGNSEGLTSSSRLSCIGVVRSVEVEVEEVADVDGWAVLSKYVLMVWVSLAHLSLVEVLVEPLPMFFRSDSRSVKHFIASLGEITFLVNEVGLPLVDILGELRAST